MKLEQVNINRFRSIEVCDLTNCGMFNVLIGKNNSGKSNILSAINIFFACISDGAVRLKPPANSEIDFFEKNTVRPIEITLTFSLLLTEHTALIQDIVKEAPQVKNAVDSIDPDSKLSISVIITPPPSNFGYVSKIAFVGNSETRQILHIDEDAASELYERLSRAERDSQDHKAILDILEDIDKYPKDMFDREDFRFPYRYFPSGHHREAPSEELLNTINKISRRSENKDEFKTELQTLATTKKTHADEIRTEPLKRKLGTFAGEEVSIPEYVHNLLKVISSVKVLSLEDRRKPIGRVEASRLLNLKVQRGGSDILRSIQNTVFALLGVQVDAFQAELEGENLVRRPSAELDVDNFLVEVNGSGIREALRLILDVEFEKPQILLVEEPEIHLHPALEVSMMRFLKRVSLESQVFITTHSTNFLDTAEMKNVYLISRENSTNVQHLNLEEAETQIPRELGIRLSSLFMFDRLVFVEGSSDEAIIREWAAILDKNLSQANVGFVHMGGVRNFTHFATEATLSFLAKRRVRMWFLTDRDERDETEVTKMKERLGDKAKIHVLNKREIENYLLCDRPVAEFIKSKHLLSRNKKLDNLPTEKDIHSDFLKYADELKSFSVDKRVAKELCKPHYLNIDFENDLQTPVNEKITKGLQSKINELEQAKALVESIYEEKTQEIETKWQSDKLNIVPGDYLLDLVCKKYNLRFRKERDAATLAAMMNEQEIVPEIKEIIADIVS